MILIPYGLYMYPKAGVCKLFQNYRYDFYNGFIKICAPILREMENESSVPMRLGTEEHLHYCCISDSIN